MTRTRYLHCSNPDCPHEAQKYMSDWTRKNLPDSSLGFMVTDLDFVLSNYKSKKIMLLEIKTRNSNIKEWQKRIFINLNRWIAKGIDEGWEYLGMHLIRFENTNFDDGLVYFDNKVLSEQELKDKLSF